MTDTIHSMQTSVQQPLGSWLSHPFEFLVALLTAPGHF
uniref:Uncharacterized protein n=1 Tax=Anguilla anguilla TaxID=7936 RepID=A0A0E9RPZ4_ANGAN